MTDLKKILLTTDLSDQAKHALPLAITMAKKFNAKLDLLFVVPYPVPYPAFYYGAVFAPQENVDLFDRLQENGKKELQAWLGKALQDVNHECVVVGGIPTQEILNYVSAKKIDLIVMSSHGYGSIKRALLGSVSTYIVHESPVPVLTVKPKAGKAKK